MRRSSPLPSPPLLRRLVNESSVGPAPTTRRRTRVLVAAQEVVVEPSHLTGVETQFRRRQVQLLVVGAKTAAAAGRPAQAHDVARTVRATTSGSTGPPGRPTGAGDRSPRKDGAPTGTGVPVRWADGFAASGRCRARRHCSIVTRRDPNTVTRIPNTRGTRYRINERVENQIFTWNAFRTCRAAPCSLARDRCSFRCGNNNKNVHDDYVRWTRTNRSRFVSFVARTEPKRVERLQSVRKWRNRKTIASAIVRIFSRHACSGIVVVSPRRNCTFVPHSETIDLCPPVVDGCVTKVRFE